VTTQDNSATTSAIMALALVINSIDLGFVQLFPFHVDWRGLKCIELDFDLLWI
jgi:hypothetical protein